MSIMAIDPGKNGCICVMAMGGSIVDRTPMPKTRRDLKNHLIQWRDSVRIAYVERVGSMPKDGHQGAFTFGQGYGEILMGLECVGILYDTVDPRVWQASLKCMTGGNKNVSKRKAMSLWPDKVWTHQTADSCLIAEWARRTLLDAQAQKERRMGK